MALSLKNPGVLVLGAFLAFSAVNAASEMVTGRYLFSGESSAATTSTQDSTTSEVSGSGWARPVDGKLGTKYGVPGNLWISGHHTGTDFTVPTGTTVRAASAGTVEAAGWGGQYGNQIVIRHQEHLYSQYAHLSRLDVRKGDKVSAGQTIGLSGSTGNATGPHLHFEVRTGPKYGTDINPMPFIDQAK